MIHPSIRRKNGTSAEAAMIAGAIVRRVSTDGIFSTAIPYLTLMLCSQPTPLAQGMLQPSFCFVAQGTKRKLIGTEIVNYGAGSYVASCIEMPTTAQIFEASVRHPYLGLQVDLDVNEIAAVHLDAGIPFANDRQNVLGNYLAQASTELCEALLRLVRLLETPRDASFLAPALRREIIYRLLTSSDAPLAQLSALYHPSQAGIGVATAWMRKHCESPMRIEHLAQIAGMSPAVFHRRFKAATSLSPLQYQKRLRLVEARRLLMAGALDAASAGFAVGYESAAHFSREYRRLFGDPPQRDIQRLRQAGSQD